MVLQMRISEEQVSPKLKEVTNKMMMRMIMFNGLSRSVVT